MPRTNHVSKNSRPQRQKVRHVRTDAQNRRRWNERRGMRGHHDIEGWSWVLKDRDRLWDMATWGGISWDSLTDDLRGMVDAMDWDDYVDPRDGDYINAENSFEDADPYYTPLDDDYLDDYSYYGRGSWYNADPFDDYNPDNCGDPYCDICGRPYGETEMRRDFELFNRLDEEDQAWNDFRYGAAYGDYGYLNPWFWDPIYDSPSLQDVKDEYLDYLYWEYPEEHMVVESPKNAKPQHRTNRERGRRRQQPKLRHVRTEAQRRREQSVKKLRLRGEYINREQGEEGFDFTNAIRQDVRGAAAGGVVRNPDSKPIMRHESPGAIANLRRSLPSPTDASHKKATAPAKSSQPTGRKLLDTMVPNRPKAQATRPVRQLAPEKKRIQLPKHLRVPEHEEKRRDPGSPRNTRRRRAMVVC